MVFEFIKERADALERISSDLSLGYDVMNTPCKLRVDLIDGLPMSDQRDVREAVAHMEIACVKLEKVYK